MAEKKILIIGAGFGGIRCALDLAERHLSNIIITIINPTPHFEYHAGLYRVLTGRSPLEVCIPLREIFHRNKKVVVEQDMITDVDFKKKRVIGSSGSIYFYDYLVLALGSETNYYDIDGLEEFSYSIKSISEALKLKKHLHEVFSSNVIVVGGGTSGVEVAGALVSYIRSLAKKHSEETPLLTVDLISATDRLVCSLPEPVSGRIEERLRQLGVNIYLDRRVMKEEIDEVYIKDMKIKSKTVIWTAGVKGNELYKKSGLPVNSKKQVIVNEYLQPFSSNLQHQTSNIYVIGDGAAAEGSGTAHAAVNHGKLVAENIVRALHDQPPQSNMGHHEVPIHAVPVGSRWAAVSFGGFNIYGRLGWWIRRLLDLRFFLSILPWNKALAAFREDGILWESCPVCRE